MTERALKHMTDIQAVNMMLTTIGEQPIKNLNDNAGLQDASIAQDILHSTSRQVQSKGWIFNTDLQVTKTPNGKGKFVVDPNILRVDSTSKKRSTTEDIVERAGFLYDRENNTDVFASDATVVVDEVTFLPFNSLPEVARRYIAVKASRIFHDRIVGSGELHKFFADDEGMAWAELLEYQSEVGDFNIFDDYDTFRVVDRNQDANQQYAWRK